MAQHCRICVGNPYRAPFEAMVTDGAKVKAAAERYGLSYDSAKRHVRNHAFLTAVDLSSASSVSQAPSLTPVETFRMAFGFDPMDHQTEYLESTLDTIVLKGRQVGMTAAASALAIWTARSGPGNDAVVISPSQRQSSEITLRARLGLWELGEKLAQDSAGLLRLGNGSRIISLPGNSRGVRGYAPALVVIDEAAYVADDTWTAARPLVSASKGRLIVQSTPGNPVGWFYNLATDTPDGWAHMLVRSTEVPTIDPDFLAREQREMPPHLYAQEYLAQFASSDDMGGALFRPEDIDRAFNTDIDIAPLDGLAELRREAL